MRLFKLILLVFLVFSIPALGFADSDYYAAGGGVPGVSDGSIGQITHDVGPTSGSPNYIYHDKFQPTTPGKVNYCHAYVASANTDTICMEVYAADGALLAYGSDVVTGDDAQWVNITLNTEITLLADTNYYLGIQTSATCSWYKRDAGDSLYFDSIGSYDCDFASLNPEESTWDADDDLCIICNNVAGAPE